MPALKTRLDRLENSAEHQEPLVIASTYVEPNGEERPVSGYSFGDEEIFREEGETMEGFNDRAETAIRAQAPRDALVLVLEPILEEPPCEA